VIHVRLIDLSVNADPVAASGWASALPRVGESFILQIDDEECWVTGVVVVVDLESNTFRDSQGTWFLFAIEPPGVGRPCA
jgi:hypothetical protein